MTLIDGGDADFPDGWMLPRLREIATINPRHPRDLDDSQLVTFVSMAGISESKSSFDSAEERPLGKVRKSFTHFAEGDVLFAKITPCMENGKAAIARGLTNGIGCGTTELHVVRPLDGVMPEYLYHFLHQERIRSDAASQFNGTAGQLRVPADFIKELLVPVPPLPEQKRIVAKVELLLARVQIVRDRLIRFSQILKRFRQSVLAAACSGRLTADWREPHNHSIDTQNGLPNSWAERELSQVCTAFEYGSSQKSKKNGNIPVLRMGNIQSGSLDWSNLVYSDDDQEIKKYSLSPNTVLFNRTNSPELVGKTAIYRGERPAIFAGYLIRIIAGPELDPFFLNIALNEPGFKGYCAQVKSDGVSQSNINATKLAEYTLKWCPLAEQREIARRVDALFTVADAIARRAAAATALTDKLTQSILARAFRGELVPTEADYARAEKRDYESAAAHLARLNTGEQLENRVSGRTRHRCGRLSSNS